jgi:GntR family transcriptional regulator
MAQARMPRYVEIAQELRQLLAEGRAGDPIPSEAELSTRFGVSRMTARQAVKSLEADGLVYRVPGSGTYGSGREARRTMGILQSFTEDMRGRGISVSSRVIEAAWIEPDPETCAELGLTAGSRAVRVVRVRLGDGVPLALESVALPPRCSFVLDHDLARGSLHRLLEDRGIIPTEAFGTLVAAHANRDDARYLGIPAGSALLVERRRIDDQHGERIEATQTKYVGDKYVFDIHLSRLDDGSDRRPAAAAQRQSRGTAHPDV